MNRYNDPKKTKKFEILYQYALKTYGKFLSRREWSILERALTATKYYNILAPIKSISDCRYRFGPFFHLQFMLPDCITKKRFKKEEVKNIHNKLKDLLKNVFEYEKDEDGLLQRKYEIGFWTAAENQVKNDKKPTLHFHCVLGRIRFLQEDKDHARRFIHNWQYKKRLKRFPAFFHAEPISWNNTVRRRLEEGWAKICDNISLNCNVTSEDISVRKSKRRNIQDDGDRYRVTRYLRRNGIKAVRDIDITFKEDEEIVLVYNLNDGLETTPVKFTIKEFIDRYLFLACDNFQSLRIQPSGYYHGNSIFSKVVDYASNQTVLIQENKEVGFLDRKISKIRMDSMACSLE